MIYDAKLQKMPDAGHSPRYFFFALCLFSGNGSVMQDKSYSSHPWPSPRLPSLPPASGTKWLFAEGNSVQNHQKKKVHDREAFWSEKWAFWAVGVGWRRWKKCAEGAKIAQKDGFVRLFSRFFASFCSVLTTPIFQKSTPNFQKALTFESEKPGNFSKFCVIVCCITI